MEGNYKQTAEIKKKKKTNRKEKIHLSVGSWKIIAKLINHYQT